MRKIILIISLVILSLTVHSNDVKVEKSLESSITKDYNQDGVYSLYERTLRKAQTSVYVILPEKRGYWYTILDRIKTEEEELLQDSQSRMRKR